VALCDYFQGYELVLPAGSTNFNDIWKQKMVGFDLGKREQGESITYRLDGKALLATSEGKRPPLIQVLINYPQKGTKGFTRLLGVVVGVAGVNSRLVSRARSDPAR
jgi:hypothetical protein